MQHFVDSRDSVPVASIRTEYNLHNDKLRWMAMAAEVVHNIEIGTAAQVFCASGMATASELRGVKL